MRTLKLYAPAIVLLCWAILDAVGFGLTEAGLILLAIAVFSHTRAEVERFDEKHPNKT